MKDQAAVASWRQDLLVTQARLSGLSSEEAEASVPDMEVHGMEVSFDQIPNPARRRLFRGLPISFVLSDTEVDSPGAVAVKLMLQSPEYERVLVAFGVATDE